MNIIEITKKNLKTNWANFICIVIVFSILCILKYHYSTAKCDDLLWILRPTASVVELITSIAFPYQKNIGFVSETERLIIAPVCAGINFLIVLIGMSSVFNIFRLKKMTSKLMSLLMVTAAAYVYTVIVNSMRIISGLLISKVYILKSTEISAVLHKMEGIMIFFGSMYLFHIIMNKIINYVFAENHSQKNKWLEIFPVKFRGAYPLMWYLGVVVLIPVIANGREAGISQLTRHIIMVTMVPALLIWISVMIKRPCGSKRCENEQNTV